MLLSSLPAALAPQDFNGDGYDDLAIGAPGEALGTVEGAGVVHVLYGSAGGIVTAGSTYLHQNIAGVADSAEYSDSFGAALAHGDFNGDGFDDLAVGAPGEDGVPFCYGAGMVHVFFGGAAGLSTTGQQFFKMSTYGLNLEPSCETRFGATLAAADVDGDGDDELAIGMPGLQVHEGEQVQGGVIVLEGNAGGLNPTANTLWTRAELGFPIGSYDDFGSALAFGDFDADGHADLAIGAPGVDVDGYWQAGVVHVLYGTAAGLTPNGDDLWHQNTSGILGTVDHFEDFGAALAAGDLDGDGHDDLAVGAPFDQTSGGDERAGAVHVIFGSNTGLSASNNQRWHQDSAGVSGFAQHGEYFGFALAVGGFDGDAYDDLAVGIPSDLNAAGNNVGAVQVFYGGPGGLSSSSETLWTQNDTVVQTEESGDLFGKVLAVGDFNGTGLDDLVVAAPGEDFGVTNVGVVHVLYAGIASGGSEYLHQDRSGVADAAESYDGFGSGLSR